MTATVIVAHLALLAGLLSSRSMRGGFSGKVGTYLSLPALAATVAALVLVAIGVGWWAVASFLALSVVVGILITRPTLYWWILTQPAWMLLTIVASCAGWALYLAD